MPRASLRVAGDAFGSDEKQVPGGPAVGQGSWEDVDREWVVAGEDPWATYRYAGTAAHLACALELAGVDDPEGVDWEKEAVESYAWAEKNTRPGDETQKPLNLPELKIPRAYAAAALFRLTGETGYEARFLEDTKNVGPKTVLNDDQRFAPWLYALGGGKGEPDAAAHERIRAAVLATADDVVIETPARRALRLGRKFFHAHAGRSADDAMGDGWRGGL